MDATKVDKRHADEEQRERLWYPWPVEAEAAGPADNLTRYLQKRKEK